MATQYSNKPIVLDGLVYALDFGNQKSYVSGSSVARSLTFTTTSGSFTGNLASASLQGGLLNFNTNPGALGNDAGTKIEFSSLSNFTSLVYGGEFTLSFVVRTSTSTLNQTIFMGDPASGGVGASRVGFTVENGFYNFGLNYTPSINALGRRYPAPNNTLEYRTIRYKSGSWDHFVNGLPITASSVGVYSNPSFTIPLVISGRGPLFGNMFTGSLGLMHLYNRSLTSDEIWNNYQLAAPRYGLGPLQNKPYSLDENAYLFLQSAGITDPIITSSIDTFVRGLKSASLWDKMIAIYPFVGTGSVGVNLTGSHRWNLKEPSLVTYPLSFTGSWNGSISGSTPSGSNTNISAVGITPSIVYPNYLTSSVHISILSYDTPVSRSYLMGTGMTEDLAASTLAGDYGTPAAAYSVRKVRTAYTGALMDVRRSIDNVTSSIGYLSNGDLDTGSLLDWTIPGRNTLPGAYSGLAAAYSLRRVSASYSGNAIRVRGDIENQFRDIGFDASGNLDTGSLLYFTATGSNTLAGSYSGIAAAYSLRKVVPGYSGYVIEVRTGTVSQSIGFDSFGNLDTGSLLTFAGGSSAFIKTWYDQSGNNRHATQSVDAQQPRIVNNGLLVTQSGRPALDFNGSYDMVTTPFPLSSTDGLLLISVDKPSVATANKIYTYDTTAGQYWNTGGLLFSQQEFRVDGSSKINLSVSPETLDYKVRTYYATSTNAFMSINGRIAASSSYSSFSIPSPVNAFIGKASGGGAERYVGLLQELIFYSASQAANKNYIESNINAYYNVFTTSSTSTENAFVSTWYDQSGNNRHATQTTASSQPLIVSSGSLVTENGKPTIDHTRTTTLELTSDLNLGKVHSMFGVVKFDVYGSELFGKGISPFTYGIYQDATNNYYAAQSSFASSSGVFGLNFSLLTIERDNTTISQYKNSSILGSVMTLAGANNDFLLRSLSGEQNPTYNLDGKLSEVLIYTSSQAANRPLIENNINNYYNIYTGSNHGFVARWYDQSGNNRHATQTATGSQPVIVESGSVIFEGTKPSLGYDGSNDYLIFDEIALNAATGFLTLKRNASPSFQEPLQVGYPSQNYAAFAMAMNEDSNYGRLLTYARANSTAGGKTGLVGSLTDYKLFSATWNGSGFNGASFYKIYDNNTLQSLSNSSNIGIPISTQSLIGASYNNLGAVVGFFSGKMQEVVLYPTDQSSIIESIHYGINSYYNIYTQPSASFATSSFAIYATSGSVSASLNNRLTSGISTSGPLGLITVSRTGSNSLTIARNGVTSSFAVPASGALSTGIYLGAINNNGLALGNSPLNISFASVGTGLSNSETVTLNGLVGGLQGNLFSDTDATAFIQAAGLTGSFLDDSRIPSAISYLTQNLKRYGLWSKMIAIYPFVGNSSNSQKINLKNPSLYPLSYGSGYTFSTQNGSVPGATITGFNMGVNANTLLSPNSGSIGFYTPTNVTRSGWTFGNTQFSLVIALYGADTQVYYNYSNTTGISRTPVRGFYAMSKTGSFVEGFYNSSRIYSGSQSTGSINGTLTFGTGQGTTSDAAFTFGYVADSLTTSEVQNLYGIVQTYQTILGRQV